MKKKDQYQYLGNCPPTPPMTQQQSIGFGEGLVGSCPDTDIDPKKFMQMTRLIWPLLTLINKIN